MDLPSFRRDIHGKSICGRLFFLKFVPQTPKNIYFMKIEHVAMYVNDLEAVRLFFIRFFGAVSNEMYHNPRTGLKSYFLSFEDGARLEIMTRPDLDDREKALLQTGYIHLAFSLGSRERVDELTAALHEAGYAVVSGPRVTGDGFYESGILGPENNLIELTE